jgi:signal transduction histidine kinase
MQSVFWNLIVNAMEAMPGGGAIHIAASAVSNRVQITVEDNGPGLPATIRDRLFEPFVTAGKAGGVGLGLAISRETVRCHGGDLWSEPARGARFVMWLPRHKRANRQKESQ